MKIVVRGTNWIGDSVMSVPALRALRLLFPDDEITLHTRSWAEGIFRDADFIDQILTYNRPETTLAEVVGQARVLREKHFDVAVIFPNSFASALTARLAGIPRRFGDPHTDALRHPAPATRGCRGSAGRFRASRDR